MSEEKKAMEVELLNAYLKTFKKTHLGEPFGLSKVFIQSLEYCLNLIEKQQKEIEELKQNRDDYKEEYIKLQNARYYNYISKDKIREKIEEIRTKTIGASTGIYAIQVDILEELLEEKQNENNRFVK